MVRAAGPQQGMSSSRLNDGERSWLRLLSGFELIRGDQQIHLPMHAQRLVAFLAFQERPVPRSYVAGTLWLDSSDERSNASLRSSLWRIGRVARGLVDVSNGHLCLSPSIIVDVREVTRFAETLDSSARHDLGRFDRALTGDLLPGWYDDWVLLERERVRQLLVHALERVCCQLTERSRYSEAIEAGLAAVRNEPLRESAYRALIAAHLAEGNRAEALRQYRAYARSLREELDLAPSPQIEALMMQLRD